MERPQYIAGNGTTTGGSYENLPYPSMPFAYSQPSHLEALAGLFGFDAPAASQARVLELGCASGGNIIPLAKRFPKARFLGVDLSRKHIDAGRERITALNVSNVTLTQADLTDFSSTETFDYVICHGVFSWVPKHAQDAIFRICNESLAVNGIVAISYNVLPGWHLRRIVRDLFLHYAADQETPQERVAQARKVLDLTARLSSQTAPYGLLLRNEAERMARMPASYISGEFLSDDNMPCYFHEFIERAERNGLGYLCEGDLASSTFEVPFSATQNQTRTIPGETRTAIEQYKDFVTGRTFRRSILVRTEQGRAIKAEPSPDRLLNLHVASHLSPAAGEHQGSVYQDTRGRTVAADDPTLRRVFSSLANAYPSTVSVSQLTDCSNDGMDRGAAETRVRDALFKLISAGQAIVSSVPQVVGRSSDDKPRAWSVARAEAATRQPWITSLHHEAVPFHPAVRYVIAHLNGENDRRTLLSLLTSAVLSREIDVPELNDHREQIDAALAEKIAAHYVEQTLEYLETHAVLEPTNP